MTDTFSKNWLFSFVVLIAGAFSVASAQDAKRPGAACQAAKDQESLRYIHTVAPLTQQADQIKQRANQRKVSCGSDRSCIQQIELEEQKALRQNTKDAADESARHEKAMIDIEHQPVCAPLSLPEAPCDRSRAVEVRRYSLHTAALAKKKIDDRNRYDHDLIDCGLTGGSCRSNADRDQQSRLVSWQNEVDRENLRHHQELRLIETGVGCELPREQPDLVSASSPERPREQPELAGADTTQQSKRRPLDPEKKRQRIDAENRHHLNAVADLQRLMDQENQNHAQALKRAGSNAKLVAEENRLHETHMRLLRIALDQEGSRFDASMSHLKAQ